jgi:hypothetical protein
VTIGCGQSNDQLFGNLAVGFAGRQQVNNVILALGQAGRRAAGRVP